MFRTVVSAAAFFSLAGQTRSDPIPFNSNMSTFTNNTNNQTNSEQNAEDMFSDFWGEKCSKNRIFRRMRYLGLRAKAKKKFK